MFSTVQMLHKLPIILIKSTLVSTAFFHNRHLRCRNTCRMNNTGLCARHNYSRKNEGKTSFSFQQLVLLCSWLLSPCLVSICSTDWICSKRATSFQWDLQYHSEQKHNISRLVHLCSFHWGKATGHCWSFVSILAPEKWVLF